VPGDLLYGVKLTGEKIQVGLTSSQSKQAQLHVQFAQERVNEINKVLSEEKSESDVQGKVQIAVAELKKDMQKAQDKLDIVKQEVNSDKSVVDSVRDINIKAVEISTVIEQKKIELSNVDLAKTLDEAKAATFATSVKAVEVMVDKKEKGQGDITDREIVDTLSNQLNTAMQNVQNLKNNVVVPVVASENQKNETVVPVTVEITDKSAQAGQVLNEAKELLSQGDLTSTIDKIKESAQLVQEVQVSVENAANDAKNTNVITPIVVPVQIEINVENSIKTQNTVNLDNSTDKTDNK